MHTTRNLLAAVLQHAPRDVAARILRAAVEADAAAARLANAAAAGTLTPADIPDAATMESAAVDALAEARAAGLLPLAERLRAALDTDDEAALYAALQAILDDLPGMVAELDVAAHTDATLVERILTDATYAGHHDAQIKRGAHA